jgi:uncharacterized membrane protein
MFTTVFLLIACALVAVAAVPLLLKLVPQNPIYGFPTERALDDSAVWFAVNRFLGRALLIAVGVTALALMFYSGTWLKATWAQFAAFLVPLAVAIGATFAFERRLQK